MPYQITVYAYETFGEWRGHVILREVEPDGHGRTSAIAEINFFHVGGYDCDTDFMWGVLQQIVAHA